MMTVYFAEHLVQFLLCLTLLTMATTLTAQVLPGAWGWLPWATWFLAGSAWTGAVVGEAHPWVHLNPGLAFLVAVSGLAVLVAAVHLMLPRTPSPSDMVALAPVNITARQHQVPQYAPLVVLDDDAYWDLRR